MINRQRLIKLTQKLIRINSENPPGNEKEIVSFKGLPGGIRPEKPNV